ncbi:MAG: SDR family NAD(P)-dependent oxidoreductase [bacterium]|nr:SDR family NAD(P)-dependent oxidoreductase [bacterium]
MKRVLIVGATAAMVRETARLFAEQGAQLCLAARDDVQRGALAAELRTVGAEAVHELAFEAEDLEASDTLLRDAIEALGGLDALLIAHGAMPDQAECEADPRALQRSITVNALSVVWLATVAANHFEAQGTGCLAVISSGAGERGRRSTYAYGISKSMVTAFLQGLRARLHRSGVAVVTILPCFVDTPMTAYLPRAMRWVSPVTAGRRIHAAMVKGKDVVHIPRPWRLALWLARNLPEGWVKRSRSEERFAARLAGRSEKSRA